MTDNPFDVFETADVEDVSALPDEEASSEPEALKSARDLLKFKVSKKLKDGSPGWKSGYSEGYLAGLREGKKIGFQNGYDRAIRDAKLPE
jgi:flagellar biosynthesis/type III secretory pathway protein FliH